MWGCGCWFGALIFRAECSLCGSVLMLAGQVPVCDLFPAASQSVGLSWGKHNIVQLSYIVQLSTGTFSEQGVTLTVPGCVTHNGECQVTEKLVHASLDPRNPTYKFRFYFQLCQFSGRSRQSLPAIPLRTFALIFLPFLSTAATEDCIASSLVPKSGDEPLVFIFL